MPAVAVVFPAISLEDWILFKRAIPHEAALKATHADYLVFQRERQVEDSTILRPFVAIQITFDEFRAQSPKPIEECRFSDLCAYANSRYDTEILSVADGIREKEEAIVLPLEYLHVIVQEIGSDEINDLASLYDISEIPGFHRRQPIFENERLFLNYALAVASSYAVKRHLEHVLFSKVSRRP